MNATSYVNGQPTWTTRKPRQSTTARLSYALLSRLLGRDPTANRSVPVGELGIIVRHKGREYAADYTDLKSVIAWENCKATFVWATPETELAQCLPLRHCTIRKGWE